MASNKKLKAVTATVTLLITGPIWFYLLYRILVAVEATNVMWFLYIIYIPAYLLVGILSRVLLEE